MTAQARALKFFGIDSQRHKLAEECAELGAAALRMGSRTTAVAIGNFYEELADVEIMIEQMRLSYGDSEIDAWRAKKLTRLEKLLDSLEKSSPLVPETAPGEVERR